VLTRISTNGAINLARGAFISRQYSRHGLYDAGGMDAQAIRRAALITLRRAICERFPPGKARAELLSWLGTVRTDGRRCTNVVMIQRRKRTA
jgi:hypothetical protein